MKIVAALAAFVVVMIVLGVLFIYSGIYDIAATSGHLPMTRWLLTVGMERSVEQHADGIEVPPLSAGSQVLRGLRHFEAFCLPCHGAPGISRTQIGEGETPIPPELSDAVPKWNAAELYWIVKHGIKYTGMPGFGPSHREDELWAIVAFLLRLPGLTAAEYEAMTKDVEVLTGEGELIALAGPPGGGLTACVRCHGLKGAGKGVGAFPRLAGQSETYLYESLKSYGSGARPSGIMRPIAEALTDDQMKAVAAYYAGVDDAPYPPLPGADPVSLQRGGVISAVGLPEQGVQACRDCHGPSGVGRPPTYPVLAGQYADYTALQLSLWKKGMRGGGPGSAVMADIAAALTDAQIEAVSLYFATVRPSAVMSDAVVPPGTTGPEETAAGTAPE